MNCQYRTYMKREIRKTYPLLLLGILFLLFMGMVVAGMTSGMYEDVLIQMSGHDTYNNSVVSVENLFLNTLFGNSYSTYYTMAILIFLVLLLQKTFLYENRSGVADFLQVLPIRERDKILMKLINAHMAIALYSLSFGAIMSISCWSVNDKLQQVAEFYYKSHTELSPYVVIWQSTLLQFLGMSATYLIFFLTISCIHNRFLSYAIGIGLMISPAAFCMWYDNILCYGQESVLTVRYFIPCYFFPDMLYMDSVNGYGYSHISWEGYREHIFYYIGVIVVAAALIVLAVFRKWHIREAHNVLMNEEIAAQFVITGISLCAGLFGSAFVLEMVYYDRVESMPAYWAGCLIITVMAYVILSGIRYVIEKRQQAM